MRVQKTLFNKKRIQKLNIGVKKKIENGGGKGKKEKKRENRERRRRKKIKKF